MVSTAEQEPGRIGVRIVGRFRVVSTNCLLLMAFVFCASDAAAQEVAVPDKPVQVAVTSYRIIALSQTFEPEPRFTITYVDNTGRVYTDEHEGPSQVPNPSGGDPMVNPAGADAFLRQMNTADFRSVSVVKRLLQHLVQHGKIPPATVTGTPEK